MNPPVSAVIPTRHRPGSLLRALESALAQTHSPAEVIVVIDGPDPATESMLSTMTDERLRVLALPAAVGGSEARNVGVRAASGQWIAFLANLTAYPLSNGLLPYVAREIYGTNQTGLGYLSARRIARAASLCLHSALCGEPGVW